MRDKERTGQPKKFEDVELQELLDENPGQTFLKLSIALNVTPMTISKHLHAIRKIHKEGRWLSHEMSENAILNRLSIATSLFAGKERKKSFLLRIVTGDEKWIYLDNPKRRKLGVNSSQLQCQRRIFAGLRPCSAHDGRMCFITSYCIQIKPL